MPGSCSSNSLNGCAACAPGLVLFSISASANFPAPGCPTYLNSTFNSSRGLSLKEVYPESSPGVRLIVAVNFNASTSTSTVVQIEENEDGSTTTTTKIQGNSSRNGIFAAPEPQITEGNSNQLGLTISETDSCGNTKIITQEYYASKTVTTTSPGGSPNTTVTEEFFDFVSDDCFEENEYCTGSCTTTSNCEGETKKANTSCTRSEGEYNSNGQGQLNVKVNYSNQAPSNEPEPIVNKQISKLKTNIFPAACKCGEGRKDDCWGVFSSFTFTDPTVTISKAVLKIGVKKEDFDKKYQGVGGTVKFYIPSEQDIEEGRIPCCNDDFSGTVVTSKGFGLGGSSFREGEYLATNIGELSTGPIGETVVACIEITSVSFI